VQCEEELKMTAMMETDLQRKYTAEERDALLESIADALEAGDNEEANRLVRQMPMHPRGAKIIADVFGKEYLLRKFNITHANEVYGEGWLNDR
jgi:acyl-CoA reductase-like NAD-dependent aldehyde dehydrogenase